MSTPHDPAVEEIAAEQRYVDRVYTRLERAKKDAAAAEAAGYGLAKVGTFGALVERDAMVFHAARRRRMLDAEHEGLVFGRLDMHPGTTTPNGATPTDGPPRDQARSDTTLDDALPGAPDAGRDAGLPADGPFPGLETRYVGRLGLRDDDARALIIDWRAPAAAPFYRATPADPLGVVRRRMIASTGERVTSVEDDLLDPVAAPPDMRVVGDGALVAALSKATGPGMRDIVATIQREQDDAIRSPASGVTIVRGGPGTGKTAVALHRAAYLLYSDRQRFAGGGVLVVGPSPTFVNYISRVLPSLGEDEVSLASLGSIVPGIVATRHDNSAVATVKGSTRMVRVLQRAARDDAPDAPRDLRLLYSGQLLRLDAAAIARLKDTVLGLGSPRNAVRRKAAGHVLDTLWQQARELLGPGWKTERGDFAEQIAERREFVAFMRGWWPVVTPADVLGWLADPARLRGYANGLLDRHEIEVLSGGIGDRATVEDVALLDELGELLGEAPKRSRAQADPYTVGGVREVTTYADRQLAARRAAAHERPADYREYAHIVVDESQDVSPMQWRMIGRRAAYASWTIVGDPAQAAWRGDLGEVRRARDAALRGRKRHEFALTTNYRNSAEIFEVAARVIRRREPDIELPVAVRQGGVPPELLTVSDLESATRGAVAAMVGAVAGTIGVIATQATRDGVASWLGDDLDPRVQVVTSLEAKGMEYDGVVVVDPGAIVAESPSGVRTLYVALSRATQRLTTVATDDRWLR